MTLDQIQLAAHQIAMYKAYPKINTKDGLEDWRAHNRAAAEIRERIGFVYQPYKYPNKARAKEAYTTIQETHDFADFAAHIRPLMGKHTED